MQRIAMFFVSFIMVFILARSVTYAAGVPLPYRIGGTITSSGGLLTQADTKKPGDYSERPRRFGLQGRQWQYGPG
ncbi:secreted protein [Candidatus Magnetobacterium bavaricum]|uniref:Secreted protein n=1 Tax=Candidatus Magnetobacterium bavaricum TaxID=29290 RepID=A0A0F3GP11_9BACT|nr:secreted protein [Candidatus Magnetobacterium bavaricum]